MGDARHARRREFASALGRLGKIAVVHNGVIENYERSSSNS